MTNDAIQLLTGLLNNTVDLMNGITAPGTNLTYLQIFLSIFSVTVIIKGVKFFFGVDQLLGSGGNGVNTNSSNIKISNERKGDTK